MSKTKSKTHSEVQHLQGRIRSLQKENRALKQKLKQLEKWEHALQGINPDETVEIPTKEIEKNCPNCNSGHLQEMDFNFITLITCTVCDYNERKRNK